jgi:hypothetical protein
MLLLMKSNGVGAAASRICSSTCGEVAAAVLAAVTDAVGPYCT